MVYAIGVDAGKTTTKAYGRKVDENEVKEVIFKTRMHRQEKSELDVYGNSHLVCFNGREYIMGDQGEETDPGNSKATLLHQLAIYTAIAQFLDSPKDNEVVLTIGCPASIYKNNRLKEEYRDLIYNQGTVNIGVDGEFYEFNLLKVIIRCEGTGIVYIKPELFKGKRVALLDIGGRNFNLALLENGAVRSDDIFTSNLGSMALEADIKDQFIEYALDDSGADLALRTNELFIQGEKNPEATERIKSVKNEFATKIINQISTKGINLSLIPLVIIGGTSINLEEQLKVNLKHAVMLDQEDDPQKIAAKGFFKVSLVKASKI